MAGTIVAMGGGTWLDPSSRLDRLLLELASVPRPRVCFLPTATEHPSERVGRFYEAFAERDCRPYHVGLLGVPRRPAERVAEADVVLVNGGNTANALALWRVHGVDRALREVWERGGVLGGPSAGGNCWFEAFVTDSFGPELRPYEGLGFLPGSFCPHYDGEPARRPTYERLIADGFPPGLAADDDAAAVFAGTELREAVAQRPGAGVYRVTLAGTEPLPVREL